MSDIEKIHGITPDLTKENVDRLLALFPDVATETTDPKTGRTERAVDFDALKERLGDVAEGNRERYQFTWPGKREAKRLAREPIAKTLRPVKERSKDWDTTRNLYIEGDNLDALKLLRENYAGKVKLIYIDPPYNTGHDFIYKDNFGKTIAADKSESGDYDDEGGQLVANPGSNGRFHSDWCSMIYPRLLLARDLLTQDGAIFISIDDNERCNLEKIGISVFGSENYITTIPWRKRTAKSDVPFGVSQDFEWIVCFAKSSRFTARVTGAERKYYETPDFPDRPWRIHDLTKQTTASERPNSFFTIINPKNGKEYPANPNRTWAVTKETIVKYTAEDRIVFPGDYDFLNISKPALRYWKADDQKKAGDAFGTMPLSTKLPDNIGMSLDGTKEITELFGNKIFSFPKPVELIKYLVEAATKNQDDAIILDFFSGSATTAQAVMQLNSEDRKARRFILAQLPEKTDTESEIYGTGFHDICEIAEERIRRAGEKIKSEIESKNAQLTLDGTPRKVPDIGFRVLRVDDSNYEDRRKTVGVYSQGDLDLDVSITKSDRSDLDLLFEALPKFQLPYDVKIDTLSGGEFDEHTVYSVNDGQLLACFEPDIPESLVRALAAFRPRPSYVLVSERSLPDSAACTNFTEIFKQSADSKTGGLQIRII